MPVPEQLEAEILALEQEVGEAAFPDTRASVLERLRADSANVDGGDEDALQLRAAEKWASRLSMLRIIKQSNPSLYEKMARGD